MPTFHSDAYGPLNIKKKRRKKAIQLPAVCPLPRNWREDRWLAERNSFENSAAGLVKYVYNGNFSWLYLFDECECDGGECYIRDNYFLCFMGRGLIDSEEAYADNRYFKHNGA